MDRTIDPVRGDEFHDEGKEIDELRFRHLAATPALPPALPKTPVGCMYSPWAVCAPHPITANVDIVDN